MTEADEPSAHSGEQRSSENKLWWAEVVKDLTSAGLATIFMTEDSIRSYLKEKKLPKEMISAFLEGVSRKRDDLYTSVTGEVTKMLSKADLTKEIGRFLETHDLKVDAKVRFEKRDREVAGKAQKDEQVK